MLIALYCRDLSCVYTLLNTVSFSGRVAAIESWHGEHVFAVAFEAEAEDCVLIGQVLTIIPIVIYRP